MQRRTLLKLGAGATAVLALAGGGLALWQPGLKAGKLTPEGRRVFEAVARAVLDGSLPSPTQSPVQHAAALQAHLQRLDETVAAFPPAVQEELSQLLAVLSSSPGRIGLARLHVDWPKADVEKIQSALHSMRYSSSSLRCQAYHALRDLTNAAYFADPATWSMLGYPGPRAI